MTGVYILLALSIAVGLAAVVVGIIALKKRAGGGVSLADVRAENERLKSEVDAAVRMSGAMTTGALNAQAQSTEAIAKRVDVFTQNTDAKLVALREAMSEMKIYVAESLKKVAEANAKSLAEVKADNQAQLEKMRETVDEKLSSTLEKRFNQSFEMVNKRLEEINRTFGELQSLQSGVNDLNKIFKNVKTRGTWGEVALDSLLSQILTSEQYDKQVRLTRGSDDAVDFVIRMPGKGDGEVLLPIDAKFPMEDYARLVEASEAADADGIEQAVKALANRVKQEAMSIRDKYVKPPKTTDFAIMYLPTEGLYAEIIKREGLVEDVQNKYRIVICGPTTIAALLNSLQMGFKSVAIEKRSAEISKLLRSFVADFEKFTTLLRKTGDNLSRVQTTLGDAEKRTDMIRQKLDKVSKLSGGEEDGQDMLEPAASDYLSGFGSEVADET
ncbi:MAG: DNA recombination protein RmuC [Clostridia bacterium]|nr:DNA recombination protein RmuC [Clostridia bacterium]